MTVLYSQRTLPLSANASNTAFSANVDLAYDFTGIGALAEGVPWAYVGATLPVLVKSGTQTQTTINGEPTRLAANGSLYDYTNTTNYGLQAGAGDFTIAVRINLPATLPTTFNSAEVFRVSGASGTALSLIINEWDGNGWYLTAAGSTAVPLGATNTAIVYPANTTLMVWVRKASGVVTILTQNATALTDADIRYQAGSAASVDLDGAFAARIIANYCANATTTWGLASIKKWSVAHSDATINAIGKDYWDTEANAAVTAAIAITSPTTGSTIATTSVISGTYTGTAPTGIEVQHAGGSWVAGTSATIIGGTWSASFVLTAGASANLVARESNATAVVSSAITGITVSADAIAFTIPDTPANGAVPFRIFQRNGSNQASVRITGTYTGTPTSIQYQFDSGSWTTLVASPAGGVFDATVTLTGPAQGILSVRFSNATGVTASLNDVGVGDVFIVAGQSNHVGGGAGTYVAPVAPGAHPAWKASIYDKTGRWRENVETTTDPFSKITNASIYASASAVHAVQATSATATNSYFGKLATACMAAGIPVAFVPVALGSTALATWAVSASTSTLYGAMLAVATTIGAHKAVLWWQGEGDCSIGTTRSAYESGLNALIDDWCITRFPTAMWVLMNLNAAGNTAGSGGTGASDTGFNAIHAAISNVAATNIHVGAMADMDGAFASIHYASMSEVNEVALRAYNAIIPLITSVATATLNLVSAAGAAIISAAGLKWAWFDQITPDLFAAPTDQGSVENTDDSGVLVVNLPNSTKTTGQVGWLIVTNSDGNPATVHKAFSGPVAVG